MRDMRLSLKDFQKKLNKRQKISKQITNEKFKRNK